MPNKLRLSPFGLNKNTKVNTTSSITDTRYCPVCNKSMPILMCNGVPAYTCIDHHIALPVKDSEVSEDTTETTE